MGGTITMRIHLAAVCVAAFCVLGSQADVWAQGLTTGGSTGLFGNRTLGTGVASGTRSFARGSTLTTGGTTGGMEQVLGGVGELGGSERFVRGSRQPGQFVGASSEQMQQFVGAIQAGQTASGQSSQLGLPQRGTDRATGTNRPRTAGTGTGRGGQTRNEVRTSLRLAFDYPAAPTRVSTALAARVARTERIQTLSPVSVLLRDGTATLRGVVATDRDRELVEGLARLEPGIWEVKNELVVAQRPAGAGLPLPRKPSAAKTPEAGSAADTLPDSTLPLELPPEPPDAGPPGDD